MKPFMGKDFLIHNETGLNLFDTYAKDMPIFDYHNHLSAREIYERRNYENLTQLWLEGDHYKWRAMRIMGVPEQYITGNAPDHEKFRKWAETVEQIPGNPLYHWAHMELHLYFGIEMPLSAENAEEIWNECAKKLTEPGYDALGLLEQRKVAALCTTDEPADSLEWHFKIKDDPAIRIKVLPTFRPDRLMNAAAPGFQKAVAEFAQKYGTISTLDDMKGRLCQALDYFQKAGCLLSDHGYLQFMYRKGNNPEEAFQRAISGEPVSAEDAITLCSELQYFLGTEYARRGMAMQLHLGAQRDNNSQMLHSLGINCGCDSVGTCTDPAMLSVCLDDLVKADALPNTVLYCLNPGDNPMMSTMAVNYAKAPVRGKVQFGAAWWFADNVRGISRQMDELLETGLFAVSLGMLTDSRSFTSFGRHEYFRRILCNKLGNLVESGEYPNDAGRLGKMIRDICFNNAASYFGLKED